MKNANRIYLVGILFLIFGQLTLCMDVPKPTPQKKVSDPALHISIAKVNAELVHGILTKNLDVVQVLLAIHADPNAKSQYKWTPLHWAVVSENDQKDQMVRLLLKYGADVNARTWNGSTPLDLTKGYPNDAVVEALLAANATLSLPNPDEPTPLEQIKSRRDSRRRESEERKSRGRK